MPTRAKPTVMKGEDGPTIGRAGYLVSGVALFAIKHHLDRFVATGFFGRRWGFFNYLIPPEHGEGLFELGPDAQRFYGTLLLLAVPFIVVGVTLTLRRLRSAGLPAPLVVLFFVPVVNLVFFLVLSALPERAGPARLGHPPRGLEHWIPTSVFGSAVVAIGLTLVLGAVVTLVGANVLERYGWGLFVGLPFAMGLLAALVHGYHAPRNVGQCLGVALAATLLLACLLLAIAVEGILCLFMAAPIAAGLAAFGGMVGYVLQRRAEPARSPAVLVAVALSAPFLMAMEQVSPPPAPLFEVTTTVDVGAPPDVVWEQVVAFGEIAPPKELLFRLGIAYPIRAVLDGSGPGAVRHCVFSTGSFVEPITAWEPPWRLAFGVSAQPAPMQEWTPWRHLRPAHLDGYLRSERGEFRLTALPGGRTRLEGTTWYRHDLWPAAYWRLWTDAILHRIHARVLRHIGASSEAARRSS